MLYIFYKLAKVYKLSEFFYALKKYVGSSANKMYDDKMKIFCLCYVSDNKNFCICTSIDEFCIEFLTNLNEPLDGPLKFII